MSICNCHNPSRDCASCQSPCGPDPRAHSHSLSDVGNYKAYHVQFIRPLSDLIHGITSAVYSSTDPTMIHDLVQAECDSWYLKNDRVSHIELPMLRVILDHTDWFKIKYDEQLFRKFLGIFQMVIIGISGVEELAEFSDLYR